MRAIIATEAYYHNERFYDRTLSFFGKFAAILKKNMVGDGYFELPLPEQQPPAWSNFYECFIEDFIEFAIFISRQVKSLFLDTVFDSSLVAYSNAYSFKRTS